MKNKKGLVISTIFAFIIFGVSLPLFITNHKKIKADTISNLTNTTWYLNSTFSLTPNGYTFPDLDDSDENYYINFTCNNINYNKFYFEGTGYTASGINYEYPGISAGDRRAWNYSTQTWVSEEKRTIIITGGTDVTNSRLISWLQNNATQQITPNGTEITHKYWASYLDIIMTNNEVISDDNISYKVLLNTYTDDYNDETLTGLAFTGLLTSIDDNHSYIISINNNDPITLYKGNTNEIDNPMLLEFTLGDLMDDELYDLMDDTGVWFDDARAYMAGTNFGSIYGFNRGVAYGEANATQYTSLVTNILNGLGNILSIQVFPNITIGLLIGLPLLLGVLVIVLKILRG